MSLFNKDEIMMMKNFYNLDTLKQFRATYRSKINLQLVQQEKKQQHNYGILWQEYDDIKGRAKENGKWESYNFFKCPTFFIFICGGHGFLFYARGIFRMELGTYYI